MKRSANIWVITLSSLCLFYIALRFWNLTASCLWFDEIFSVHAAVHDWKSLFWFVAQDLIHPPLFYVLLKIWISIGGESLFWLRLFPVIFSIAALIPFYFFCRQLKLQNSARGLALFFFAANGALIKYAQEVRMYSVLLCLSLFSLWIFTRYFNLGKSYTALIIINILLVYTHYFGWFLVLSQVCIILALQNIKARQIFIMSGIVVFSFTPWIYAIWLASKINANLAQNIGWMSKPDLGVIFQFAFDVIEPFYYQQSSDETTSRFFITVPLLLIIVAAKLFYFKDWVNKSEKHLLYLIAMFISIPILLVFMGSWILPVSIWGTRHLIIVFVPMMILSAKLLAEIKIDELKYAFLAVIFVLFGITFFIQLKTTQTKYIWCAWEEIAPQAVNINGREQQKIYVFEELTAYQFWYALRNTAENVQILKIKNLEGMKEDTAYFLPRGFKAVKIVDDFEGEKFLVAFAAKAWDESQLPLQHLKAKGFVLGEHRIVETHGLKAFLVEAKKEK